MISQLSLKIERLDEEELCTVETFRFAVSAQLPRTCSMLRLGVKIASSLVTFTTSNPKNFSLACSTCLNLTCRICHFCFLKDYVALLVYIDQCLYKCSFFYSKRIDKFQKTNLIIFAVRT